MFKTAVKAVSLSLAFGLASYAASAATINGAGASFPYPVYAKWAADYHKETGNKINYQSVGSGAGQQQIIKGTVDFGASDDPMKEADLKEHNLLQFPAIVGGTVPVVNIDGVKPGELTLSGEVLADIYLGKITKWNDDAIKKLNPDVDLPGNDIIVVHRSDGSGTTFGWTNYLSKVSSDWKDKVGEGKAVKWPAGQGGKGNEGVAGIVSKSRNTIGYVEYAYAKQNNLAWTKLQNADGKVVEPDQKSFAAAAGNADWKSAPGMGVILTNEPGADSWPVTAASFILLPKKSKKPENTAEVLKFFDWAFEKGQDTATKLDYVALPKEVTDQIKDAWKSELKSSSGEAIWK